MATDRKSAKLVANEARVRRNILLDVTYHNQADLKERFNLDGVSALSTSQAASCDPYLLSHGLLANAVANGAKVSTGYESQSMLKERIVNLDNTYALVPQPITDLGGWKPNWMMWEAKEPYLYLRITDAE